MNKNCGTCRYALVSDGNDPCRTCLKDNSKMLGLTHYVAFRDTRTTPAIFWCLLALSWLAIGAAGVVVGAWI